MAMFEAESLLGAYLGHVAFYNRVGTDGHASARNVMFEGGLGALGKVIERSNSSSK